MRKSYTLICLLAFFANVDAQCPRKSLLEQFTSETCPPDAAANPGLKVRLDSNKGRMVTISWHTPIPSTPSATWSPYRANKIENDWRYRNSPVGYGYTSQYTPTSYTANGINSSPVCLIDGRHQWVFGAPSDHTNHFQTSYLNNALAVSSPFCLLLNCEWSANHTALTATVNITASQNFTANGSLVFRLVMVEELHFSTPPGTNGEKDFYNVPRASFPDLQNGTALPSTWSTGQSQSFTIHCVIPSNVINKSLINMVGFIQDDGNKRVIQAEESGPVLMKYDAALTGISGPVVSCNTNFSATVQLKNLGVNTINTFTVNPFLNGMQLTPCTFTANVIPGGTLTVGLSPVPVAGGSYTLSAVLAGMNGYNDQDTLNNRTSMTFGIAGRPFATARQSEPFTLPLFPPAGWYLNNPDQATEAWQWIATTGAFSSGLGCTRYSCYNNKKIGDVDELYLPPLTFSGSDQTYITFDVAYADFLGRKDKLELSISEDCGLTWTILYSKSGSVLSTTATSQFFVPASHEWRTELINLGAYNYKPELLLKFVVTNANGNNLYIDNVNLSSTTDISAKPEELPVQLYPNPANEKLIIRTSLSGPLAIEARNAIGQLICHHNKDLSENGFLELWTHDWPAGIYTIKIMQGERSINQKLIVAH